MVSKKRTELSGETVPDLQSVIVGYSGVEITRLVRESCVRAATSRAQTLELPDPLDPGWPISRLGIDSIVVAEVVDDLEKKFGVELPFRDLLEADTVGDFVALVRGAVNSS